MAPAPAHRDSEALHPFPHRYVATARGNASELTLVGSPGLTDIACAPPPQFDRPEGQWSPETLLPDIVTAAG